MNYCVNIETAREEQGDGAVRLKIALPRLLEEDGVFARRFASYYGEVERGFRAFVEKRLLPKALKDGRQPYGAAINTVVCHDNPRVLSLYVQSTVSDGDGKHVFRLPCLWDKKSGTVIRPKSLFRKKSKAALLSLICRGIERKQEATLVPVYADGLSIARRRFDEERIYLSPCGLVFFYQGGVLSHEAEPFAVPLEAASLEEILADGVYEKLWGNI